MSNRYYIDSPRGFANEVNVFVVADRETEDRLLKRWPTARRTTRKAALRIGLPYLRGHYDPSLSAAARIEEAVWVTRADLDESDALEAEGRRIMREEREEMEAAEARDAKEARRQYAEVGVAL